MKLTGALHRVRLYAAALISALGASTACGIESIAPVTAQGAAISRLFVLVLVISAAVFLLVLGLLTYVIVRYRGRDGDEDPQQVHGNRGLEVAWTAAPLLLLAVLFVPTLQTMASVDAPRADALRVNVVGHQWWWEYRYPDLGVVAANELHLPVGRPVRLELSSADVIHSFWIPRFGWKRDAIPGKTNILAIQVDEAGTYDGTCTEYCGLQHAWMRIRAIAEPSNDFDQWVARQKAEAGPPQSEMARRGQQVFSAGICVECHSVRGSAAVGQIGPDLTHVGSRTTLASGILDNGIDNLTRFVKDAPSVKPGVLMPSFVGLPDGDVSAIAAYLDGLK